MAGSLARRSIYSLYMRRMVAISWAGPRAKTTRSVSVLLASPYCKAPRGVPSAASEILRSPYLRLRLYGYLVMCAIAPTILPLNVTIRF